MKATVSNWNGKTEITRIDRVVLHLACLWRDHKCAWHLAGIWREVTVQ